MSARTRDEGPTDDDLRAFIAHFQGERVTMKAFELPIGDEHGVVNLTMTKAESTRVLQAVTYLARYIREVSQVQNNEHLHVADLLVALLSPENA
jgi:hypothetical protein